VPPWNQQLRAARRTLGLRLPDLAERSGISEETLRAYETGRRRPPRDRLLAILEALGLELAVRNAILTSAGFAPDVPWSGRVDPERFLTVDDAVKLVNARPWPAFLLSDHLVVIGANAAGRKLLAITPARLKDPIKANLLTMTTERRTAERCVSWDDTVSALIALFKGRHAYDLTLEQGTEYEELVLAQAQRGSPPYVRRFNALWESVGEFYPPGVSWTYDITWRMPGGRPMQFFAIANSVNELRSFDIDDWIPVDAATYRELERLGLGGRASPGR
jgi:transcriptional regulator with XRE-family HTH domain